MDHGIAEKPWIDLHVTLHSDSQHLYSAPHTLPSLISALLQPNPDGLASSFASPPSTASLAPHKLNPAARKASAASAATATSAAAAPASASPPPTAAASALFHVKFAADSAGGYVVLVSDWTRVWYHRATAEQVQREKAEFAEQVALATADDTIARCIQPLLTAPHSGHCQHAVTFQPHSTSSGATSHGAANSTDSTPQQSQPVLVLSSSMDMGLFRLRWKFRCLPLLSPLHQSSLLLHLTLLPQQAMVAQLHAQLTQQHDRSTRVKVEARVDRDEHNNGRAAGSSQGRAPHHVAASQQPQQARSPSPIASPPSAPAAVKSEDGGTAAVPTLESLYEQSVRASQSASQTGSQSASQSAAEDAAEAEAAQAEAERNEAQRGADGEGYWDEAKQEYVQGGREKERMEKAKQDRLLSMKRNKRRKGFG